MLACGTLEPVHAAFEEGCAGRHARHAAVPVPSPPSVQAHLGYLAPSKAEHLAG